VLLKTGSWGRDQIGNPEEEENSPSKVTTKQRQRRRDCGHLSMCVCVCVCVCNSELWSVITCCINVCSKSGHQSKTVYSHNLTRDNILLLALLIHFSQKNSTTTALHLFCGLHCVFCLHLLYTKDIDTLRKCQVLKLHLTHHLSLIQRNHRSAQSFPLYPFEDTLATSYSYWIMSKIKYESRTQIDWHGQDRAIAVQI
jgi:hypothetical protein